ncbi:NAD(P)H-dependent oxidoreductase [Neolewinella maritima]|nr:NAD(P)H-dependent oxidoreductase [Neolewinella maritima]
MELLDALRWRYATKRFDPSKKVQQDDLRALLEAVNLSASSFGLQHYRIVVVEDPETKQALRAASYDQAQLTESSHVLVLAAKTDMTPAYVDDYMQRMADTRGLPVDQVQGFGEYIKGTLTDKSTDFIIAWNKRQAYTGLGTLLAAAAELRIDSCPMEGFQPEEYDRILGLTERGLTATVIAPIGYRAAEDATQTHKKVRLPLDEMVITV